VITLNDEIVDLSTLESRLVASHAEKPDTPVIVRPDKTLPVQQLVSVMDVLQRAKISKVGVATRSEQSE
jgi:biopolymer transport protein ExbD